jgi:hypothetical protein
VGVNELNLDAQDIRVILEALSKEPYYKVAATIAKVASAMQPKEIPNAQPPA